MGFDFLTVLGLQGQYLNPYGEERRSPAKALGFGLKN